MDGKHKIKQTFFQGLLALEGELTPILVSMVKSANTNGLLDKEGETSKYQHVYVYLFHCTIKPVLSDHIKQDIFLALLIAAESRAVLPAVVVRLLNIKTKYDR